MSHYEYLPAPPPPPPLEYEAEEPDEDHEDPAVIIIPMWGPDPEEEKPS